METGKTSHPTNHYQFLRIEIFDRMAVVALNNPPSNSLKIDLLNELDHSILEALSNPEVKVIIITGAGKSFSIGADIKEMSTLKTAQEAVNLCKLGQKVCMRIENSSKPVIAAISGFCLGGGLELAISCQLRIASQNSILGMPEISVGMIPAFGGSYRMPILVGKGIANQLILTGERIQANRALAIGLVNTVVHKVSLLDEAKNMALKLAEKSAVSLCMALRSISESTDSACQRAMQIESDCLGKLYESHDLKEGVFACLEKRKPFFTDN